MFPIVCFPRCNELKAKVAKKVSNKILADFLESFRKCLMLAGNL